MEGRLADPYCKFWLFYINHMASAPSRLSRNILREVCSYMTECPLLVYQSEDDQLCIVSITTLVKYTCEDAKVMGNCFCLVDSVRMFYLAKGTSSTSKANQPHLMPLDTYERTALNPMLEARYHQA